MKFKLIMALVKPHITDDIIDAMKKEGATGAFFLVEEHVVNKLLDVIQNAGKFDKPGTGIAFVLPIDAAIGLESQMKKFKNQARDQYL